MASASLKTCCVTCGKNSGQFKCEGCSQIFCTKHVVEHRQVLNQQLDEVIVEHDTFQQTIMEDEIQCQSFFTYIDQWEQDSIDKIHQLAKEMRERTYKHADTQQNKITQELQHLKGQIKKAREEDDFFETDLRNWITTMEKLKQQLKNISLSNTIREDKTAPLVYKIQAFLSSNKESTAEADDTPNLVNTIHPKLQYTNQDGICVNPKSWGVTAIWYFYSPTQDRWFWTPYGQYNVWMSVDELTVKSGHYKNQQPPLINIEIIKYLRENNPVPSSTVIDEALKVENRFLKL